VASGTIRPGDVDWIRISIPRATTRAIVDVDFADNGTVGSALIATVVGGTSAFNQADNNAVRDNFCGLGSATVPLGSPRDSAVEMGATPRNAVIDVAITGAGDFNFNGQHTHTFDYALWLYAVPVSCTINADCADSFACTFDSCDLPTGVCSNTPMDSACDDGLFCTGAERCDAAAGCRPGNEPLCGDGVPCTIDFCDSDLDECAHEADDFYCDNGYLCDGAESCDPVHNCRDGEPIDCDDGIGCTVDRCDEEVAECVHVVDPLFCDNENFCDGRESCDPQQGCVAGSPPACNDGVGCTVDECDAVADECTHEPDDGFCDNGQFCDGTETCDPVHDCVSGEEPCPDQFCNEDDGACLECMADENCDDGEFCNGQEWCHPEGKCAEGDPPCTEYEVCDADAKECTPKHRGPALDIRPGECPNKIPLSGTGQWAAALVGTDTFDVRKVNLSSLFLYRADGLGGKIAAEVVQHRKNRRYPDVATPFPGELCGCHMLAGDGIPDLLMRFMNEDVVKALQLNSAAGKTLELRLAGRLQDGSTFEAADCVMIRGPRPMVLVKEGD